MFDGGTDLLSAVLNSTWLGVEIGTTVGGVHSTHQIGALLTA